MGSFVDDRYAPVRRELVERDLDVRGVIPEWLDGRYLRNGPNPVADVAPDEYNWFTGDGMVHGIRLCDGDALWYRNRWVDSEVTSRLLDRTSPDERGRSALHGPSANTNVIGFAGRTLALVEGGTACAELSSDLETLDVCDFGGTVRGGYTGHPVLDPNTGELHAVSYHFGRGNTVQYTIIGPDGCLRRKMAVPVQGSPMMHAFSLTRDYVVLYDLPVTFDPRSAVHVGVPRPLRPLAQLALSSIVGRVRIPPMIMNRVPRIPAGRFPYRWNPDYPARVGLLPRSSHDPIAVTWIELDQPCYVFHPMNAHNDDRGLEIDLVVHERVFDADPLGPTDGRPRLERWRIDLRTGSLRREALADEHMEFPRIDDRRVTSTYQHGWAVGGTDDVSGEHRLLRTNATAGIAAQRDFGNHSAVGEFSFAPSSPSAPEGDGVVMGLVTDLAENTTELRILDAQSLEDVAAVRLPQRVPAGFHGNWIQQPQ
ncbi:carotenoid oxygenase family protein [Rhodococcus sp. NPDC058514]|uniref:carotenoid oxygenase family protein n=1 Tax=unclassified Rhodococcus (in: high G+C Gram-positive bacteria) TaxID=192944 RepID=UPI00365A9EEF